MIQREGLRQPQAVHLARRLPFDFLQLSFAGAFGIDLRTACPVSLMWVKSLFFEANSSRQMRHLEDCCGAATSPRDQ